MKDGKMAEVLAVRARPGAPQKGTLSLESITVPCVLGKSGLAVRKREGDGKTPVGRFALLSVYYRPDRLRRPITRLPVSEISPDLGWCDDPGHPRYNRPVKLPFSASHERMWREDGLYDVVVVLDHNLHPPVPGLGSAIFFHCARPGYSPTEGCVAVSRKDMLKILERCGPGTAMAIG
ncbi:L,D-transpeptidase family protein [Rhizobiales bacterium]|uniref:L,D-transpeptidase family protein n=1 Tax=Hongsoonwoonella zoysiae TaxID=2821844 RepID=UPI0015603D8F|nr:L,D-transpeptidase family protein [Hongsoonwoonella zoysiae]NRG17126.1 L,D-transpeptidase family protein [Hongsoonwoonella zoysiae]